VRQSKSKPNVGRFGTRCDLSYRIVTIFSCKCGVYKTKNVATAAFTLLTIQRAKQEMTVNTPATCLLRRVVTTSSWAPLECPPVNSEQPETQHADTEPGCTPSDMWPSPGCERDQPSPPVAYPGFFWRGV